MPATKTRKRSEKSLQVKYKLPENLSAHNNGTDIVTIPATRLFVDPAYQRISQGSPRAKRIGSGFRWGDLHTFLVAPRPKGRFAVVDGGHRLEALELKYPGFVKPTGEPINLRCEVLPPSKKVQGHYVDEADSFLGAQNEQRAPSSNDAFKARLYKRERAAVRTFNVAKENGILIRFREPGKSLRLAANETRHGGTFYWAYSELGEADYKFLMRMLNLFVSDDDASVIQTKALQGAFIRGLVSFIRTTDIPHTQIRRGLKYVVDNGVTSAGEIVDKAHEKTRSGYQRPKTVSEQIRVAVLEGLRQRNN